MLSREDVIKIAKLSKLEFNDKDIEDYRKDLSNILDFIELLNEVNVENVEPLFNVLDIKDRLRKDEISNELSKEDFLNNSPEKDNEYIVVPKIIGE